MKGKERLRAGLLARLRPVRASSKVDLKTPLLGQSFGDDSPNAEGFVVVKKIFVEPGTEKPTGEEEIVLQEKVLPGKNLVVTQARNCMAAMAAGLANSPFNYIELGDPLVPTAPALTDTTLQQTTGQRQACVLVVAGNTVSCTATWLAAQGNGFTYTESGLFTGPFAAGTMFARKSGFSITKTNAFQMQFLWYIVFNVLDVSTSGCAGVALLGSAGTVEQYIYVAAGGELQVVIPIDFAVGANRIEFFLMGQRMVPTRQYIEAVIGANKGVTLIGFALALNDVCFFRHVRF